jgi:hypothetical protein
MSAKTVPWLKKIRKNSYENHKMSSRNRQKPTKNRQNCRFRKMNLSVFVGSETDKTKPTKTDKNRRKPLSIYKPGQGLEKVH